MRVCLCVCGWVGCAQGLWGGFFLRKSDWFRGVIEVIQNGHKWQSIPLQYKWNARSRNGEWGGIVNKWINKKTKLYHRENVLFILFAKVIILWFCNHSCSKKISFFGTECNSCTFRAILCGWTQEASGRVWKNPSVGRMGSVWKRVDTRMVWSEWAITRKKWQCL